MASQIPRAEEGFLESSHGLGNGHENIPGPKFDADGNVMIEKVAVPPVEEFVPVAPLDNTEQQRVEAAHAKLVGQVVDIGNDDNAKVESYPGVADLKKKVTTE